MSQRLKLQLIRHHANAAKEMSQITKLCREARRTKDQPQVEYLEKQFQVHIGKCLAIGKILEEL
jgi:hypothetical protein